MDIDEIEYSEEQILVVDDEEFVSGPVVEMLRHLGFQAESVNSSKDALKELTDKPYTFLLTDIKMPDMDGLELIRRTKGDFPHISTVAMTGYYKEYNYVDVVNSGATDFINKPFGIEELEAKIRRAIIERNIKQVLLQRITKVGRRVRPWLHWRRQRFGHSPPLHCSRMRRQAVRWLRSPPRRAPAAGNRAESPLGIGVRGSSIRTASSTVSTRTRAVPFL